MFLGSIIVWSIFPLDLRFPQNNVKIPQHKTIKHEQVDQARYGFDQINYSGGQPSTVKKKQVTEVYYRTVLLRSILSRLSLPGRRPEIRL